MSYFIGSMGQFGNGAGRLITDEEMALYNQIVSCISAGKSAQFIQGQYVCWGKSECESSDSTYYDKSGVPHKRFWFEHAFPLHRKIGDIIPALKGTDLDHDISISGVCLGPNTRKEIECQKAGKSMVWYPDDGKPHDHKHQDRYAECYGREECVKDGGWWDTSQTTCNEQHGYFKEYDIGICVPGKCVETKPLMQRLTKEMLTRPLKMTKEETAVTKPQENIHQKSVTRTTVYVPSPEEEEKSKTIIYVGIGLGVVLLAGGAYFLLAKR